MEGFGNRCLGCMEPLAWEGSRCLHCGFLPSEYEVDGHRLPLGSQLKNGDYTVGKILGEGGFGVTYLGFDNTLLDAVAIKEYYPALSKGPGRQAFLEEARMLARFGKQEGVVHVRGFFEENNAAYIVMDYIKGVSIREYVEKYDKINSQQVLGMMHPILRALYSMHEKKLLHRDISADNLIIQEDGHVTLIDFGAVRNMSDLDNMSRTMMFKSGFSPIEQYSRTGNQGAWTDIYGVCATMYFMLTGEVPVSCTERIGKDTLKSLVEMDDIMISKSQKEAIMKGLEVESSNRFQSVKELYEALYENEIKEPTIHFREMKIEKKSDGLKTIFTRTSIKNELNELEKKRRNRGILVKSIGGILIVLAFGFFFFLGKNTAEVESVKETKEPIVTKVPVASDVPVSTTEPPTVYKPTKKPVAKPTKKPVVKPTKKPVVKPTKKPVVKPTKRPVAQSSQKKKKQVKNKKKKTVGNLDSLF